jgi:hypothetical protein
MTDVGNRADEFEARQHTNLAAGQCSRCSGLILKVSNLLSVCFTRLR